VINKAIKVGRELTKTVKKKILLFETKFGHDVIQLYEKG
jgi:hypothetical protein